MERRKIFVSWLGKLCCRVSGWTFNAIWYARTEPQEVSTRLLAIRSRDKSYAFSRSSRPFSRESVYYPESRYKQGLRLPDAPRFLTLCHRAFFGTDAFFAFLSTKERRRDGGEYSVSKSRIVVILRTCTALLCWPQGNRVNFNSNISWIELMRYNFIDYYYFLSLAYSVIFYVTTCVGFDLIDRIPWTITSLAFLKYLNIIFDRI